MIIFLLGSDDRDTVALMCAVLLIRLQVRKRDMRGQ